MEEEGVPTAKGFTFANAVRTLRSRGIIDPTLSALLDEFGSVLENRQHNLMSSPSVMAALGAIVHALVGIQHAQDRKLKARELLKPLKAVDWSRGKPW